MTRKDFVLIAETVKNLSNGMHKSEIAGAFADALVSTNPRFDKGKFINACMGVKKTK